MAVFFTCKSCGGLHPSPIAFGNKKAFENSTLVRNAFQCPKTAQMDTYDKKDMVWKDQAARLHVEGGRRIAPDTTWSVGHLPGAPSRRLHVALRGLK